MLTALYSSAQEKKIPVDKEGRVVYTNVLMAADTNTAKTQIYAAAKIWLATTFKAMRNPVQLDDAVNGRLVGKGSNTFVTDNAAVTLYYSIEILVKKGKLKYKFYDIYFPASDTKLTDMNRDRAGKADFAEETNAINKSFNETIASLAGVMNKQEKRDF